MATDTTPAQDATAAAFGSAREVMDYTPLMFMEVEPEDVREGMVLRFQAREDGYYFERNRKTGVAVVRTEHFSPLDEALVIDAEDMPAYRVSHLYRDYRVSALTTAIY